MKRALSEKKWLELLELSTRADGKEFQCPKCDFTTHVRRFHFPRDYVDLDVCMNCELLWFDKNEIEEFPVSSKRALGNSNRKMEVHKISENGELEEPKPLNPDEKAKMLLTYLKVDEMARKARNRSKYWTLRRVINTPWMLEAYSQEMTDYATIEDLMDG